MHATIEARAILQAIPREHYDTRATWLRRAGASYGLTESQAKKIWYGEIKRMDADTLDRMRTRLLEMKERENENQERLDALTLRIAALRRGESSAAG